MKPTAVLSAAEEVTRYVTHHVMLGAIGEAGTTATATK